MQRVAELMRADFIALPAEESRYAADRLMRLARVRHLPVLRDEKLLGVLSCRDLLEDALARLERVLAPWRVQELLADPVEGLVQPDIVSVSPDCSTARAAQLMLSYGIGFLPVVDPRTGRLLGIVTEADLLRAAYADADSAPD